MSTNTQLTARVLRRELHSPKSGLAITLAVIAIVALAWLGTESVLAALGQPKLLLSPTDMGTGIRGLAGVQTGLLVGAGVVLAIIGLVLVIAALSPGRRGRHTIAAGDSAAVVDDAVVASALVRTASSVAGISPDRAVASVGKRSATVRITPVTGASIDRSAVQRAVDEQAQSFGLQPAVRAKVVVNTSGKVGS